MKWPNGCSELDVEPTDQVLEVGFGPGLGIQLAAAATPDGSVAGVDYSRKMVETARARNAATINDGRVDLRYGPATDLPYKDGVFGAAFSINSMQIWPDALAGIEEIQRVLKPRGQIALAFTPVAGKSQNELRDLLSCAGFDDIRVVGEEKGICARATK